MGRRVRAALHGFPPVKVDWRLFDGQDHHVQYRLRKPSGTRLYRATKDFTRVGLFLGHSSVDTTRRYVAMEDNDVQNEVEDF